MNGYIMWHVIYINTIEYYSALKRWKFSTCIQIYISVYVSVNSDNFIYPFPILITFIYFSWCWNILSKCFTALREAVSSVSSDFLYRFFLMVKIFKTVLSFWWLLLSWVVARFCRMIFCINERILCVFDFILCVCMFSTLAYWCWGIDFNLCIPVTNPTYSWCLLLLMLCLLNLLFSWYFPIYCYERYWFVDFLSCNICIWH